MLCMSENMERSQLYSDTSKLTTGSLLYQIENGQSRLMVYAGKEFQQWFKTNL